MHTCAREPFGFCKGSTGVLYEFRACCGLLRFRTLRAEESHKTRNQGPVPEAWRKNTERWRKNTERLLLFCWFLFLFKDLFRPNSLGFRA